jgi:hypothetical protein
MRRVQLENRRLWLAAVELELRVRIGGWASRSVVLRQTGAIQSSHVYLLQGRVHTHAHTPPLANALTTCSTMGPAHRAIASGSSTGLHQVLLSACGPCCCRCWGLLLKGRKRRQCDAICAALRTTSAMAADRGLGALCFWGLACVAWYVLCVCVCVLLLCLFHHHHHHNPSP